jgi:hypothetical protein
MRISLSAFVYTSSTYHIAQLLPSQADYLDLTDVEARSSSLNFSWCQRHHLCLPGNSTSLQVLHCIPQQPLHIPPMFLANSLRVVFERLMEVCRLGLWMLTMLRLLLPYIGVSREALFFVDVPGTRIGLVLRQLAVLKLCLYVHSVSAVVARLDVPR